MRYRDSSCKQIFRSIHTHPRWQCTPPQGKPIFSKLFRVSEPWILWVFTVWPWSMSEETEEGGTISVEKSRKNQTMYTLFDILILFDFRWTSVLFLFAALGDNNHQHRVYNSISITFSISFELSDIICGALVRARGTLIDVVPTKITKPSSLIYLCNLHPPHGPEADVYFGTWNPISAPHRTNIYAILPRTAEAY